MHLNHKKKKYTHKSILLINLIYKITNERRKSKNIYNLDTLNNSNDNLLYLRTKVIIYLIRTKEERGIFCPTIHSIKMKVKKLVTIEKKENL